MTKAGRNEGAMYFTLLTRQFLIQGLRERKGQQRIDENPVGLNSYNVPFYNVKQEGLDIKNKLVIIESQPSRNLLICNQ